MGRLAWVSCAALLFACAPPPRADAPGTRPAEIADAAAADVAVAVADASPVAPEASAASAAAAAQPSPRSDADVRLVLGEGACDTAEDCVVGEAFAGCGVHSCTRIARSHDAQRRFDRELVRRCGELPRDRMPCPFYVASQAACEQHRCAFIDERDF